jgi:2-polyprenyl-3-methyl-5-hydroxy-6-metoxy-1,4-benzoquinol methylase
MCCWWCHELVGPNRRHESETNESEEDRQEEEGEEAGAELATMRPLDTLSEEELAVVNDLLPWQSYVLDSHGRQFGKAAAAGKRSEPQEIPDRRIRLMDERFVLNGKRVLEVGCFEGIHTVGLMELGAMVLAMDARIEHVIKTTVRCFLMGLRPLCILKQDLEEDPSLPIVDLIHHVGVLYHLSNPAEHLLGLAKACRGLMLDTHYAREEECDLIGAVQLEHSRAFAYRYKLYQEGGRLDAFSGMATHSKWLRLCGIVNLLNMGGFMKVEVVETREERNGPRALLFASS